MSTSDHAKTSELRDAEAQGRTLVAIAPVLITDISRCESITVDIVESSSPRESPQPFLEMTSSRLVSPPGETRDGDPDGRLSRNRQTHRMTALVRRLHMSSNPNLHEPHRSSDEHPRQRLEGSISTQRSSLSTTHRSSLAWSILSTTTSEEADPFGLKARRRSSAPATLRARDRYRDLAVSFLPFTLQIPSSDEEDSSSQGGGRRWSKSSRSTSGTADNNATGSDAHPNADGRRWSAYAMPIILKRASTTGSVDIKTLQHAYYESFQKGESSNRPPLASDLEHKEALVSVVTDKHEVHGVPLPLDLTSTPDHGSTVIGDGHETFEVSWHDSTSPERSTYLSPDHHRPLFVSPLKDAYFSEEDEQSELPLDRVNTKLSHWDWHRHTVVQGSKVNHRKQHHSSEHSSVPSTPCKSASRNSEVVVSGSQSQVESQNPSRRVSDSDTHIRFGSLPERNESGASTPVTVEVYDDTDGPPGSTRELSWDNHSEPDTSIVAPHEGTEHLDVINSDPTTPLRDRVLSNLSSSHVHFRDHRDSLELVRHRILRYRGSHVTGRRISGTRRSVTINTEEIVFDEKNEAED
ncbi:hypothetical protein BT63DRAFT_68491 [Microthyrium microscopicum]|uniref:Uncharacterized protein n=1 Tax=Microthyrium microscopicum TaxID=703497 RepID=A0A6A6U2S3_9PEZI|nr:hypothetical protein BT63DRAFT_68491 [Microthyrium microscopicum]